MLNAEELEKRFLAEIAKSESNTSSGNLSKVKIITTDSALASNLIQFVKLEVGACGTNVCDLVKDDFRKPGNGDQNYLKLRKSKW